MNLVNVTVGNKKEREITQRVIAFCIKKLLPRFRTLEIDVDLKNIKSDAVGYCLMEDDNRMFTIEVQRGMTIKDLVTTVCHEMVHVKQYARKEMTDELTDSGRATWKGSLIKPQTKYYDLPWEKEAYKMQDELANEAWENNVV